MEEALKNFGVGVRPINDPFFDDSYRVCKVFQRKGITVEDDEESCHQPVQEFPCYAPECRATFKTLLDFEMHYNTSHRYICTQCKKSRPNPRLLDIHIQETHDNFFKVLAQKQPMYQCYVSDCHTKFNNPIERKEHCIAVHKFPKHYRFDTQHGQKAKVPKNAMEVDQVDKKPHEVKQSKIRLNKNQRNKMFAPMLTISAPNVQDEIMHSTTATATTNKGPTPLMFIPRQLQRSYSSALTKGQSKIRNVLETQNMMDLAESLPHN